MGEASHELKKHGSFKLTDMLALKLKKKSATSAQRRDPIHQGNLASSKQSPRSKRSAFSQ